MIGVSNYSNFVAAGSPSWKSGQTSNWRGGAFDGWRHVKSAFALDFRRDQAMCAGQNVFAEPCVDVSRQSPRILEGAADVFQIFDVNEPAQIVGTGLFVGGEFVNKIRNPRGEGGVAGTVGVTNKCSGHSARPVNAAEIAKSGNASAVISVVDKLTDLQALAVTVPWLSSYIENGVVSGQVFKLDNTLGGAGNALASLDGLAGNTNKHSISGIAWVSGTAPGLMRLTDGISAVGDISIVATTPTVYKAENLTPNSGAAFLRFQVGLGGILHFVLFDLVEAPACPPVPTVISGASATGALPVNWRDGAGSPNLPLVFLGTGIENGLPYADVRYVGTAAADGSVTLDFDSASYVVTSAGQAWGADFRARLLAGTLTFPVAAGLDSSSASIAGPLAFLASTRNRFEVTRVLEAAGTSNVSACLHFYPTSGSIIDVTFRIYAPKLVQLDVVKGPDLVTDGGFADLSGWTLSNCTISGGVLNFNDVGILMSGFSIPADPLSAGAVYEVTFDLTATSGSGVSAYVGGVGGEAFNATGEKIAYMSMIAPDQTIGIVSAGAHDFVGSVDNLSVKMVVPGFLPDFPILPQAGVIADSLVDADNVTAITPEWLDGLDPLSGMSNLVIVDLSHAAGGTVRSLFEISDGTEANSVRAFINSNGQPELQICSAGVFQARAILPFSVTTGLLFLAFGWSAEGGYVAERSGGIVTFGPITLPSGLCCLQLGGDSAFNFLDDMLVQTQTCPLLSLDEVRAWFDNEMI